MKKQQESKEASKDKHTVYVAIDHGIIYYMDLKLDCGLWLTLFENGQDDSFEMYLHRTRTGEIFPVKFDIHEIKEYKLSTEEIMHIVEEENISNYIICVEEV